MKIIIPLLRLNRNNVMVTDTELAKYLGIGRTTLWRYIDKNDAPEWVLIQLEQFEQERLAKRWRNRSKRRSVTRNKEDKEEGRAQ